MLLVVTRVAPSAIHGLGLFAGQFIEQGSPIWQFVPGFDQAFSSAQFAQLPPPAQAHLRWFAFLQRESDQWILSGDHACFMNHSATPNTGTLPGATPPVTTVALRDIAAGEELTCDYFTFDGQAKQKLGSVACKGN